MIALERDTASGVELDALALEEQPLRERCGSVGADAHHAARVDDTVPRHGRVAGQRVQCVSDESRLPHQAGECRDLAVRRHAPARNAPDDGKNGLVCRDRTRGGAVAHRTVEAGWGT